MMLRIALLELRLRRAWGRRFTLILLTLSVLSAIVALNSMKIRIDYWVYTCNVHVPSPLFVKSYRNPDIFVRGREVFVKGDMKSLSAFDEFRKCIRAVYREWIYRRFGEKAFPVAVRVIRVGEVVGYAKEARKVEVGGKGLKRMSRCVKKVRSAEAAKIYRSSGVVRGFKNPEFLRPPSLLGKLIYAFSFIIPMYFVIQVYSSSLMEDKIKRRLELLFAAEDEWKVVFGKFTPYLITSMLVSGAIIFAMGKSPLGLGFLFPIALFLIALGTFTAFVSRSYKEMTFLTIIISIFVTVYLFIPAIFVSDISDLSPVAVMLRLFSGSKVSLKDYIVSTFHFYVMSAVLLYMSLHLTEVMNAHSNPIEKLMWIGGETIRRYWMVPVATLLSIPFVLLSELFFLSFTFRISILLALLAVGLVEEFTKGLVIYSAVRNCLSGIPSSILAALGFFIGEKLLILPLIKLNSLILLPLAVHITTSLLFLAAIRYGFWKALIPSTAVHVAYDGVVLWTLLGSALRI